MTEHGPTRVVLDTNVIVSALLFQKGPATRFRHFWQHRLILPLVSQSTSRELTRVLAYPKFRLSIAQQEDILEDYLPFVEMVNPKDYPNALARIPTCRDPHDDMFLESAQAGNAELLVSGDQDLLDLNDPYLRRMGFHIVSLAEALKRWTL